MTIKEFLSHCTMCGGDWVSMLLSGIKVLYPEEYPIVLEKSNKLKGHGGVHQFAYITQWLSEEKGIRE